jgi:chemotaxis protein CheX
MPAERLLECIAPLVLPEVLDLKAAAGLHASFTARRGQDLSIDASQVRRLGGQCLQVLLAAVTAWKTDGRLLAFDNPSESFVQSIALFGVTFAGQTSKELLA